MCKTKNYKVDESVFILNKRVDIMVELEGFHERIIAHLDSFKHTSNNRKQKEIFKKRSKKIIEEMNEIKE